MILMSLSHHFALTMVNSALDETVPLFRRLSRVTAFDHRRWGCHLSACVLDGPRRHRLEAHRLSVRERPDAGMVEDEEPRLRALAAIELSVFVTLAGGDQRVQ